MNMSLNDLAKGTQNGNRPVVATVVGGASLVNWADLGLFPFGWHFTTSDAQVHDPCQWWGNMGN